MARFRTFTGGLAVIAALLVGAGAARAAPADPRPGQIKALLENQGLKVILVDFAPAKGASPPVWAAGTAATYQDPSWDKVTDQALTVWNSMYVVLRKEDPKNVLVSTQDWRTYRLFVSTSLGTIVAFDAGVRAAKTDAERGKVMQGLYKNVTLRVFDLRQQKLIDTSEFAKSHFK
ncbi:MAG: hypothetical protein ACT4P5_16415 [Armatimonadota bacterium]